MRLILCIYLLVINIFFPCFLCSILGNQFKCITAYPLSDTSSFTGYSMNGFDQQEQERLKQVCDRLSDQGCQVLISNSANIN